MKIKQMCLILSAYLLYPNLSFSQRETILLDRNWKFVKGYHEQAFLKEFDDSGWQNISIPHDWAIEGPFIIDGDGSTGKLPWKGEGWYRTSISIPEEYAGKRLYLLCDGIMAFPTIYLNGELAGKWDYGYNSFYLDITGLVKYNAENMLAIHVDTRKHDSRWYPGAGIIRKIQLIAVNPIHVDMWGTYITTPIIKPHYADVRIAVRINNYIQNGEDIAIQNTIYMSGRSKIVQKTDSIRIIKRKATFETTITIPDPKRWNLEEPNVYTLVTEIYHKNVLLDTYVSAFGIRDIRLTADHGLYLNDKRVQLKGVNLHHDQGPLGAAFNTRAMERQLEIMKTMGCNAIRTSHNVPAPELLDLCDRMGFLVIDEAFDKYDAKADIVDTTDFESFAHRNIRNFVLRDRNHPSIFMWSVGNEMYEMQMNINNGFSRLQTMINYVRKYDNTRPVTMVNDIDESAKLRHFDYYDVHCWNYGRRYSLARQMEPNKPVIITESASTVSTRGFYELPLPKEKTDFTRSLQVSSYDLNAPWWAEISDDDFMWQQEELYVAGEFVWTGFDYLGEPTPYDNNNVKKLGMTDVEASRSSYFGIVDLCGIPKDRYYLYKSYWKPEENTVHILPHWNWENSGVVKIPVYVYTNANCAELFLNGRSLGMKCKEPKSGISTDRFRLKWNDVVYEPGELKAVAHKDGIKTSEGFVKTAGEPFQLRLNPDRKLIKADGKDLSYILIEAVDEVGNLCPLADNKISVKITGKAFVSGIDNGNPQSMNSFKSNSVNLFYGKAMLILVSGPEKGDAVVEVVSQGLKNASVSIRME